MRTVGPWLGAVTAVALVGAFATPAQASRGDVDGDGISNRWERSHALDPHRAADALRDPDHDRLTNLAEYRLRLRIRDEDSDNDGMDDGDEVRDGLRSTGVDDADTNNDGEVDGDENADHDGLDNEDEDDARESCLFDDDDADHDSVDDEDENELGLRSGDDDSDDDGIHDGNEVEDDNDGVANEDLDDSDRDDCDGDRDDDGEDDEDERDLVGAIASYDATSGVLVVSTTWGEPVTGVVTEDTEIDFEDEVEAEDGDEPEATTDDLRAGVRVADIEFDDKTGDLEEIEIYHQ
jgi:hypothetical protein